VVHISYHDTGHLLDILTSIPDFDAVILQSHYENIPVRLLRLLQEKTRALVVDGHSVSGVDVDRVGTDWEEALDLALEHLLGLGHQSVGLVSLDSVAQPILNGRRAFDRMRRRARSPWKQMTSIALPGLVHPTQHVGAALRSALDGLVGADGKLPFTALVTLGLSDSFGIRRCLEEMRFSIPEDLSLFILGHHDVPTEHLGSVSMAGSASREGAERLVEVIRWRLDHPDAAPRVVYLECVEVDRESTAAPRR
jgi:DNA-binding LacI/PurR family transcriptional regulator